MFFPTRELRVQPAHTLTELPDEYCSYVIGYYEYFYVNGSLYLRLIKNSFSGISVHSSESGWGIGATASRMVIIGEDYVKRADIITEL